MARKVSMNSFETKNHGSLATIHGMQCTAALITAPAHKYPSKYGDESFAMASLQLTIDVCPGIPAPCWISLVVTAMALYIP